MSDAKQASPYVPATVDKRPMWATLLGVACGAAVLAFIALGIGIVGTIDWLTATGFVLLCIGGVVASAGGYVYFLYERSE